MSDETPQRPTSNDDREWWKAYWAAQGMTWRTEPEIDQERQRYLAERRAVKPDIEKGTHPFRDIRLTRADVERLLASQPGGVGVDVRGASLSAARFVGANLARAHFDGAVVDAADFTGADVTGASGLPCD